MWAAEVAAVCMAQDLFPGGGDDSRTWIVWTMFRPEGCGTFMSVHQNANDDDDVVVVGHQPFCVVATFDNNSVAGKSSVSGQRVVQCWIL